MKAPLLGSIHSSDPWFINIHNFNVNRRRQLTNETENKRRILGYDNVCLKDVMGKSQIIQRNFDYFLFFNDRKYFSHFDHNIIFFLIFLIYSSEENVWKTLAFFKYLTQFY